MFFFYQYWIDFMREFYALGAPQGAAPARTPPAPSPAIVAASVFSGPAIDPSRERILAEALATSQKALKASEERSAAFLSSMSHELRTPLNAIMGFADMMRSGTFGPLQHPTYAQYVHDIHAAGAALLTRIDDLLGLACMHAQEHALEPTRFAVAELLAELAAEHGEEASARGLLLRPDAPAGIEVEADRAQLGVALTHLIGNALRHAREGSEVLISARVQPGEGLIVSVRDSGAGIGEAQLSAIRSAMQHPASYFAIASGGIGLGLSVAHELARKHGGRIMIDSVRKRGTVASLILPAGRITAGIRQKGNSGFRPGARKLH